jgi:hypothetical protein
MTHILLGICIGILLALTVIHLGWCDPRKDDSFRR